MRCTKATWPRSVALLAALALAPVVALSAQPTWILGERTSHALSTAAVGQREGRDARDPAHPAQVVGCRAAGPLGDASPLSLLVVGAAMTVRRLRRFRPGC